MVSLSSRLKTKSRKQWIFLAAPLTKYKTDKNQTEHQTLMVVITYLTYPLVQLLHRELSQSLVRDCEHSINTARILTNLRQQDLIETSII